VLPSIWETGIGNARGIALSPISGDSRRVIGLEKDPLEAGRVGVIITSWSNFARPERDELIAVK